MGEAVSSLVSISGVGICDLTEAERFFLVVLVVFGVASIAGVSVSASFSDEVETFDLVEAERFFLVVLAAFEVASSTFVSISPCFSCDVETSDFT